MDIGNNRHINPKHVSSIELDNNYGNSQLLISMTNGDKFVVRSSDRCNVNHLYHKIKGVIEP